MIADQRTDGKPEDDFIDVNGNLRRLWIPSRFVYLAHGAKKRGAKGCNGALLLSQCLYWTEIADDEWPRCRFQPWKYFDAGNGKVFYDDHIWWYSTLGQAADEIGLDGDNRRHRRIVRERLTGLVERKLLIEDTEVNMDALKAAGKAKKDPSLYRLLAAAPEEYRFKVRLRQKLSVPAKKAGNSVSVETIRELQPRGAAAAILYSRLCHVLGRHIAGPQYRRWLVQQDELKYYVASRHHLSRRTGLTEDQVRQAMLCLVDDQKMVAAEKVHHRTGLVWGYHVPRDVAIAERRRGGRESQKGAGVPEGRAGVPEGSGRESQKGGRESP